MNGYITNFIDLANLTFFIYNLNNLLNDDIRLIDIEQVAEDFHCRKYGFLSSAKRWDGSRNK